MLGQHNQEFLESHQTLFWVDAREGLGPRLEDYLHINANDVEFVIHDAVTFGA